MVSALWKACSEGDVEKVSELLKEASTVDIELKDHTGVTPLIEAVRNGHLEVVRALLGKGADPTNASSQGRPEQYTSDQAILDLLSYSPSNAVPNDISSHDNSYPQDPAHDSDKSYYPPPPPPGAYPYYPTINPALSTVNEGGVYYPPPPPPQMQGESQGPPGAGNLPPPEVARFIPCRYFPACRYGASCMFAHPQSPYFQGPMPPPAPYSPYDMGAPSYPPNYYPVSPPSFRPPNGVHPMAPMSPPPVPHMTHGRSPSEVVSPAQAHFAPNGVPSNVPYGSLSPSAYPHLGQMPVPMSLPSLPPSLPPPGPQSPSHMYNSTSSQAPPFTVQQDAPAQFPQQPPPPNVHYQEIDGTAKPLPTNPQPDAFGGNPVHRDGMGHRRGAARRGSFGGRKPPCLFFPTGRCKNGDDCRFPHVMPDGAQTGPHHQPYFSGRGGHNGHGGNGGPRPRPHMNGHANGHAANGHANANGFPSIEEKLSNMTVRDVPPRQQNGTTDSSRSHSTDPGSRPRFQQGFKGHPASNNNHPKKPIVMKQRVPNADEFPVLAGTTTPPSRTPGVNGVLPNGNGHAGPTAAQVLQAPPPVRKDSARESSTRGPTPERATSPSLKENKAATNGVTPEAAPTVHEQPVNKLPISFAAMATAAPDVSKEVSVSA